MLKKHNYTGKTKEEAIKNSTLDLQELEENLIIVTQEEKKSLLSKKIEIEVVEKREVKDYLKQIIKTLLKDMGFECDMEISVTNNIPTYRLYSNNDALLIGKDGKNLKALTIIVNQILLKELGKDYRFFIDVNNYKEKSDRHIEYLAKKLAREVKETKIAVKMDKMNSYQRRLVHNVLNNNKYVYTESEGEEPNRYVVIKPRNE